MTLGTDKKPVGRPRLLKLSPDEHASKMKNYVKKNRQEWASLGFRQVGAYCHDDDRELVLALLEVHKGLRLVKMAETLDDVGVLVNMSRRNLTPVAIEDAMKPADYEDSVDARDIAELIDSGKAYLKKLRGIEAAYPEAVDEMVRLRMGAKAVAYSALAMAYFRLASANYANSEKEKRSVFDKEKVGEEKRKAR